MKVSESIVAFNELAGNHRPSGDPDKAKVDLYYDLLDEEANEYALAYLAGDVVEMVDGLADQIVVAHGKLHVLGLDPEEVMQEVNNSNMSKFVTTEEDAELSVQKYASSDVYKDVHYTYNAIHGVYVILGRKVDAEEGTPYKILKGIHFFEPRIKEMLIEKGIPLWI